MEATVVVAGEVVATTVVVVDGDAEVAVEVTLDELDEIGLEVVEWGEVVGVDVVVFGIDVVVVQCFHWGSPGRGGQCALAWPAGMMTTVAASANAAAVFLIAPQKV